ncbi:MAG TPA: DUF5989 family protein [Candidatus Gracilibacteria bacterium]
MSKFKTVKDLFRFMWKGKKLWMFPLLLILVLLGLLIVFTQGSVLAPFIYTIF